MTDGMLERVKARCIEEGECWIWQGGGGGPSKAPQISIDGKKYYVRRVLWLLKRKRVPKGKVITTSCETKGCVCPDHLQAMTLSEVAARAGAQGKYSSLARCAKISASKRAVGAKLTLDQAELIRASQESMNKLAARFGVCKSVIAGIRRGDRWKEYTSPFAGLMQGLMR